MKKRYTIGFLDENAHNEYHSEMMNGVFEAARKYDLNVIRFGHFPEFLTGKYNSEMTMVLNHIRQYELDGLLFLGWARVMEGENRELFQQILESMPVLSIGSKFENIPNVYFLAGGYIQEIILHLIQVHHLQKIAFIAPRSPDNRIQAYQDTLKAYGIYQPELYINDTELGELSLAQRGHKAVSILLDERKASFDAIVSLYNDETLSIIHELQNRGFRVPNDVAVTSYEDGEVARFSTPSFTTVYYPWRELGFCGCEKMYQWLTKSYIPSSTVVPGKVIIRSSCGCLPNSVRHAKAGPKSFIKPLAEIGDTEFQQLGQELQEGLNCPEFDGLSLFKAFLRDYQTQSNSAFLAELGRQFACITDYHRFPECGDVVSLMRKLLLPYLLKPRETLLWAENLFQEAQVLLQEKKTAAWAREEIESRTVKLTLQSVAQVLITHFNIPNIMDSLAMNLPRLNLPSCYIYLFKNAESQIDLFENCLLAFEYTDGVRVQSQMDNSGTAKQMLRKTLFKANRAYAMNALLLHTDDLYTGFAIYEAGPNDERVYQALNLNISMAIYGAMLLDKLDASYQKLVEKSHQEGMTEIANGILHNISNILNSLRVSIDLLKELIHSTPLEDFLKANRLLEDNLHNLAGFIEHDPRGKKLMQFYLRLDSPLQELHQQLLANINRLGDKVKLINDIVTAQQSYTGIQSGLEIIDVVPVVEDALKMNLASLENNHIQIIKNYHHHSKLRAQRTKLFHILVNLIKNAKEAMLETPEDQRKLIITIEETGGRKYIRITDTGSGIPADKLESIFAYGYTTKKDGHGFGLHSCGNYMAEMKSKIWAESDGPGKGATFVLEFN
ncbi:MAG: substrate-binding domain-containing protein [Firmicutes bacterium]|nr:substrate-binding domain-containing protein [Bacillota bacterium]